MLPCPLAFFIIYQKRQKPGCLCTGLFDFIWVLENLVAGAGFAPFVG